MNKQPIIDGLEVHTIEFDGDDPRHQIDLQRYSFSCIWGGEEIVIEDFLNRPGRRRVRYVLLGLEELNQHQVELMQGVILPPRVRVEYCNLKNVEIIEEIARRNLGNPDRALMAAIIERHKVEKFDNCHPAFVPPDWGPIGLFLPSRLSVYNHPMVGFMRGEFRHYDPLQFPPYGEYRGIGYVYCHEYWYMQAVRFVAVVSDELI